MTQIWNVVCHEVRQYLNVTIVKTLLVVFVSIGAGVELMGGRPHLENIFAKPLQQWEYLVILACLLTIRVTCITGIAQDDLRVSTLATVLSTLSTVNIMCRPFGWAWITVTASLCSTLTAFVFLGLLLYRLNINKTSEKKVK